MNHNSDRPLTTVDPAAPSPCHACPWRTSNHGKPHPDGWYTKKNRDRLWAQLRRGERMTCHPTDPTNPVPEGYPQPPSDCTTLECCGSLILQQREVMVFQKCCNEADSQGKNDGLKRYRKLRPKGLTREGIFAVVERVLFSGAFGSKSVTKPDLNQAVSHPDLSWGDREAGV